MDELFDSQQVLRAAEIIRREGEVARDAEGEVRFRGFTLELSPDEYTICLKWRSMRLHVFFHNRFQFEGGSRRDFENMMQAIDALLREDDFALAEQG